MSENVKKLVPKWYRKMSFWNAVIGILTAIATGEAIMYFKNIELPIWVHSVVGVCGVFLILIKPFIQDKNGDGLVD